MKDTINSVQSIRPIAGQKINLSQNFIHIPSPAYNNSNSYGPIYIAIVHGEGYFKINLPRGSVAYTKHGSFYRDKEGFLTTAEGYHLAEEIKIPSEIKIEDIRISPRGCVTAPGISNQYILLYKFPQTKYFNNVMSIYNPENNIESWDFSGSSERTEASVPGENGTGLLLQGFMEILGSDQENYI
jgi:flagellar basal-body rod protein FlgG